jgi:putative ABC transport system substrate-binding protein
MRRREFITLLGGAAVAWPLAARAQQAAMPVIGWLNAGPAHDPLFENFTNVFLSALKDAGYLDGQNVEIDFRWAEGDYTRLPALAAELVAKRAALIVAGGPSAALAAKAATATIPIVFTVGADPVALGLIASLSHPGGNATGVSIVMDDLETKRLGLLREVVPEARAIVALLNPKNPTFETQSKDVRESARTMGVEILILSAATSTASGTRQTACSCGCGPSACPPELARVHVVDHASAQRSDGIGTHRQLLSWMRFTTPRSSRQDSRRTIDDLHSG